MRYRNNIFVCQDGIIVCKDRSVSICGEQRYISPSDIVAISILGHNGSNYAMELAESSNSIVHIITRTVETQLQILIDIRKEKIYDKKFNRLQECKD